MFNLFSAFGGIFFSFPLTAAISGLLCESVKGIKRRYSLRCKLKVNFSEAVAYIIHVLLHLSLLLLRISLPSPILCYTSDVRALSEWVWWWCSLPPCIVGNVRVSLHCCKYEVLQSEPSLLGEDFLRFKKKKKKIHLIQCHSWFCDYIRWPKTVALSWRLCCFFYDHVFGGGVCRVTRMLGMCSRHVLEAGVGLCCPLQAG